MTDDLRERGIAWLLAHRPKDKQVYELSAEELQPILKMIRTSIYTYMDKLVERGEWGTRRARDPESGKVIRVWFKTE